MTHTGYAYVVFEGKQAGVYHNWYDCERQVKGVKGAKYKRYPDSEQAREAFASYVPVRYRSRPTVGIASDASFLSSTGELFFRVVDVETIQEVYSDVFEGCGNAINLGEFLGLVQAIKYTLENELACPVYCDSVTAITWVTNKVVKTRCLSDEVNAGLLPMVEQSLAYLRTLPALPTIEKWETRHWGEIPADYGNKLEKEKTCLLYGCDVNVVSIVQGQRRFEESSFARMVCLTNGLPTLGMSLDILPRLLPAGDLIVLHRQTLAKKQYLAYVRYRGTEYVLQSNNKDPEIL